MKKATRIIHITTFFPPLLALLVGFSLFLRIRREDDLGRQFDATSAVFANVFELSASARDIARAPSDSDRREWIARHEALGSLLRQSGFMDAGAGNAPERLKYDYETSRLLFDQLSMSVVNPRSTPSPAFRWRAEGSA